MTDFVKDSGVHPLGNRAYLPLLEDASFAAGSATNANSLFTSHVYNELLFSLYVELSHQCDKLDVGGVER